MVIDVSAQTEEYILQEEQYRINWEKKYGPYRDKAFMLVDECLKEKTAQSINTLMRFFENKELIKELSEVNDLAYMIVMMEMYMLELEAGVTKTVFYWSDSLQGVIDVIRQVKFLLWEIEFLDDPQSGQLLLGFLNDVGISMPAFEYIVFISSYDKEKMIEYLNNLFS